MLRKLDEGFNAEVKVGNASVFIFPSFGPLASSRTDKLFTGELGAAIISGGENKCVTMNCDKPTSCFRKQETTVGISNQYMY